MQRHNRAAARFTVRFGWITWVSLGLTSCAHTGTRTADAQLESEILPAVVSLDQASPGSSLHRSAEASAEYHFSLAQAYVAEGNSDRAIEEFKLVLAYDPKSALVRGRLAAEYIKKGNFAAAMESCKEALQLDPKLTDARLILAGLYAASRDTEQAVAEYDRVLKREPDHEEAAVYRAQLLVENGQSDQAALQLRTFLKRNGDSPLAWFYLGKAEQRRERVPAAVEAFKRALDVRPGFTQAGLALGYLYETHKMNAQAVALYRDLYDQTQDLAAANRLATLLLKDEKFKEAVSYLEAIVAADTEDLNARVKLGLVQMELKRWDQAAAQFESILQRNPDADRIHYYLASIHEERKDSAKAIASLLMIQSESKLFGDARLHAAYLLKQDGKDKQAERLMEESIQAAPRIPGFHLFLASLAEAEKDIGGAVSVLERAVELFPEDEKVRYYLGSLYDRQGKQERSLIQMEAILRFSPDNVDALNYLGYTWTLRGVRLNDAEKMLRKALSLKPDNGFIRDSWGWHLYVRGRLNEAVVELEKAAKLKSGESTILEHLADAYLRLNLREKAAQRYEEAARFADDDTAREKLRGKLNLVREEIARRSVGRGDRLPAGEGLAPKASTDPSN